MSSSIMEVLSVAHMIHFLIARKHISHIQLIFKCTTIEEKNTVLKDKIVPKKIPEVFGQKFLTFG